MGEVSQPRSRRQVRPPASTQKKEGSSERTQVFKDIEKEKSTEKNEASSGKIPKKSNLPKELILTCKKRIYGLERTSTSLQLPTILLEQIEGTTSGEGTTIKVMLLALGYKELVKKYKKAGEIIDVDEKMIEEILKDFQS